MELANKIAKKEISGQRVKNAASTEEIALTSTKETTSKWTKGGRAKKYSIPNAPSLVVRIGHCLAPTSVDGRIRVGLSLSGQGITPW